MLNLLAMSLNDDDLVSFFGVFIGPILPLMISGETMWIDARIVPTLQERTGDRFMVHARKRNGMALVSRVPYRRIRSGFESVYNYSSPKNRRARRAVARGETLGRDDEWCIRDRFAANVTTDEMFYGEI